MHERQHMRKARREQWPAARPTAAAVPNSAAPTTPVTRNGSGSQSGTPPRARPLSPWMATGAADGDCACDIWMGRMLGCMDASFRGYSWAAMVQICGRTSPPAPLPRGEGRQNRGAQRRSGRSGPPLVGEGGRRPGEVARALTSPGPSPPRRRAYCSRAKRMIHSSSAMRSVACEKPRPPSA